MPAEIIEEEEEEEEDEICSYSIEQVKRAREYLRSQLRSSRSAFLESRDLSFCARTGPFFEWSTCSSSPEWLQGIDLPFICRPRFSKSRRRAQLQEQRANQIIFS